MPLGMQEILKIRTHDAANNKIGELINAAEGIALLTGAVKSGIIAALSKPTTAQEIVIATSVNKPQLDRVLNALETFGFVMQSKGTYRLSKFAELLVSSDAPQPLNIMLQVTDIRMKHFANLDKAVDDYNILQADEVLSMAKSMISTLSFTRNFVGIVISRLMPEVRKVWLAGGRHLESGCGAGNTFLDIIAAFPRITGVGVEIHSDTANEARRRANILGLTNRVEIRNMDACTLTDEAAFDTAYWSQFFFPVSTRKAALQALFRAIRPGGYLFIPLLCSISNSNWAYRWDMLRMAFSNLLSEPMMAPVYLNAFVLTDPAHLREENRLASFQKLMYEMWGIPAKTTKELKSELEDAGFRVIRAIPTPSSRLFPQRGFILAQRP